MSSFQDSKVVSNTRAFAARQVILVPLRFLRLLIVLPFLAPGELFLVRLATTWFGYTNRTSLGTFAALQLYYPAEEKLGQQESCSVLQFNGWVFAVIGSILGGMVGTVLAWAYFEPALWPLVILWGMCVAPAKYVHASLLARGRYKSLALSDIIMAATHFCVCIVGLYFWGFWGFIVGLVLATATPLWFGSGYWRPQNPRNRSKAFSYIRNSGNLWVSGTLADLAKSFDIALLGLIVIENTDVKGAYALGVMLTGLALSMAVSINHVLRRELIRENAINKGTSSFQAVKTYVYIDLLVWISLIAALYLLLHPLLMYAPQYSGIIHVIHFLLIGSMLLQLRFYPTAILNINKLFRWDHVGWVMSLVAGLATFFLADWLIADKSYLALSRVSAGLATFFIMWLGFLRFQRKSFRPFFTVWFETSLLMGWVIGIKLTFSSPFINALTILSGWVALFGYFCWRSPTSYRFLVNLVISRTKRTTY